MAKSTHILVALAIAVNTSGLAADTKAPSLSGSSWLNVTAKPGILGKVTVVHFWTFGCINCKHNLPSYAAWQKEFGGKAFQIIGVHTPETQSEHSLLSLKRFLTDRQITYPVLVDNSGKNWDRWHVQAWPTVFLIDKQGRIRDHWEGELDYDRAGGTAKFAGEIRKLLEER